MSTHDTTENVEESGLERLLEEFVEWLHVRAYATRTIEHYQSCLRIFTAWAAERGVTDPAGVSLPVLESYQRALFYRRKPNGAPLSVRAQTGHLVAVRALFRWAARHRRVAFDPAAALELPRSRRPLPRGVLDETEVEAVLAQPDVSAVEGVRDRAVLETLYSTAMRARRRRAWRSPMSTSGAARCGSGPARAAPNASCPSRIGRWVGSTVTCSTPDRTSRSHPTTACCS